MRHSCPARALILVCLTAIAVLAADTPDQETWNNFVAWYKSYTGPPYPTDLIKAYTAVLKESGKSDTEVKAALGVIMRAGANPPPEMMRLHFNKMFTIHDDMFVHEPNALLVRTVRELKPGKALDVGMGQGRNSVFLAQQGWEVTGYDLSDEGLAAARANAAKAGVRIETIQSTHDQFDFGKDRWDLVVLMYSFVNMSDRAFLARVKDSLKSGGLIVVEQANTGGTGKGPANALFRSFDDLRVVHYEDKLDIADWSKKPGRIGRIVVQKD